MSKAEIIAELARLSAEDRADVQAKLDELAGDDWLDSGKVSEAKNALIESSTTVERPS
jgi:hypothetical protein